MPIILSHLKDHALRHAQQLRRVASTLNVDLMDEAESLDTLDHYDEAKRHGEALEAIAIVAGILASIPEALNGEAMKALQGEILHADDFLAQESTQATLARAAEFERALPY